MFWIIVCVVYELFLLHILQSLVWAGCFEWVGYFPDFYSLFYYSATSYSTVGYGDLIPQGSWRIWGSIEAVTRVLIFGWSTGELFSVVNHLQGRFGETRRNDAPSWRARSAGLFEEAVVGAGMVVLVVHEHEISRRNGGCATEGFP